MEQEGEFEKPLIRTLLPRTHARPREQSEDKRGEFHASRAQGDQIGSCAAKKKNDHSSDIYDEAEPITLSTTLPGFPHRFAHSLSSPALSRSQSVDS